MLTLDQTVVDLLVASFAVMFLGIGAISVAALLVKQLKFFGFNPDNKTLKLDE